MSKAFKYFLYIVVCIFVFIILAMIYGASIPSKTVNGFEWEKNVSVYFGNNKMGSGEDCALVFPLSRKVISAETLGPGALEALLNGLTAEEEASGYSSSINDGVLIQKFEILEKVAYVDFDAGFNEGMGGSCRVQAIRSQIETTLNTLPDIDSVVISVNGETEGILEP